MLVWFPSYGSGVAHTYSGLWQSTIPVLNVMAPGIFVGVMNTSYRGYPRKDQSRGHGFPNPKVLVCSLQDNCYTDSNRCLTRFFNRVACCCSFGLVALQGGYDSGTYHHSVQHSPPIQAVFRWLDSDMETITGNPSGLVHRDSDPSLEQCGTSMAMRMAGRSTVKPTACGCYIARSHLLHDRSEPRKPSTEAVLR